MVFCCAFPAFLLPMAQQESSGFEFGLAPSFLRRDRHVAFGAFSPNREKSGRRGLSVSPRSINYLAVSALYVFSAN